MKKLILLSILSLFVISSCEQNQKKTYEADNTGTNVRDRDGMTKTSGDQSDSSEDLTITQEIRRSLMEDNSLSTNGKNIKIITINRVVTLRGPVNSPKEKEAIENMAKKIKGVKNVESYLEVVQK